MSAATTPLHEPQVTVSDHSVYISGLEETSVEVVRVAQNADDPAIAVRSCLQVGAKALLAAGASVDVAVVEQSFDVLTARFDGQVTAAVEEIGKTSRNLLDAEEGALPAALNGFHEQLSELLGTTFDPKLKTSVVSTIEELVGKVLTKALADMQDLVDPTSEDSPLGRLRKALASDFAAGVKEVTDDIVSMRDALGIADAVTAEQAKQSAKGVKFEDAIDDALAPIAAVHGDTVSQTGRDLGAAGTMNGDLVITLDRDAVAGGDVCIAIEAKAKNLSMQKIIPELAGAMENREASAVIAVFDSQKHAPTKVPFHYSGDYAFVVFDPKSGDDSALRLGYMWARWVARRKVVASSDASIDLAAIEALIADARRGVERLKTIRRNHTSAKNAIDDAGEQVTLMAEDVRAALDALSEQLNDAV